jgi:hypothetical protein
MGAYLRAARLARRVSIDRAAEETRIRPDFLKRMESDEFDYLAPAYVRGFLRSYAKYLRIDPEPLIVEFETRYGGGKIETAQIAALERHGKKQTAPRKRMGSWSMAAALAGGVLVILAIVGILQGDDNRPKDPAVAIETPDEQVSPSPSPEPSESAVEPTVTPTPEITPDGDINFDDGIDLVILANKGDCWIEVASDGVTQEIGRVMAEGEKARFSAEDEMAIELGFPDGVELVVNGRNIGTPIGGSDPIDLVLPDDIDRLIL